MSDSQPQSTRLKLRPDQLEAILGGIADSLWVFNPAGDILYVNEAAVRMMGFPSAQDFLNRHIDHEWRTEFRKTIRMYDEAGNRLQVEDMPQSKALRGLDVPPGVYRVRMREGLPEKWTVLQIKRLLDARGELEMMIVLLHDITEIRSRNEVLRQREGELSLIYENSNDLLGLIHIEAPGLYRILTANRAYFALASKKPEEVIGKRLEDWLTPEGFKIWETHILNILQTRKPVHFESSTYTIQPPLTLEQVWTPIFDESGSISHILVVARNVTELKRAQERLRQSEKMEAVGQLAGGIAHDFNNLLTAINGFAYMALAKPDLPSDLSDFLEGIRKAGERAAALTSQLLAYSRKTVLQPKLLNLNTAVTEMENILRRVIGEDINLTARLTANPSSVKVDPGQMSQIIMNLAVNARDAMPQGGDLVIETGNVSYPESRLEVPADAPPGAYVVLTVRDTGAGMSPQVQARMFEPFFTTKEVGHGTGLGLASVYGIVKQSGGYIGVQSEPGKGTAFRIFLPSASLENQSDRPDDFAQAAPGGNEFILLVEDEDPVRGFIRKALESFGYAVKEAGDGEEALRIIKSSARPPQLLITDIIMPGMRGTDLAEKARRLHANLKVVYISGYAENSLVLQAMTDPGAQLLQKPFSPAQLAKKIRESLDQPAIMR